MNKIIIQRTTTIAILAIIVATTTTATNVRAGAFGDLGNAIDKAGSDYKQGKSDGESAGVNGGSSNCPSNDTAYCLGYSTGYSKGSESRETVDRNSGNREDDGEFVESDDDN